MAGGRNGSNGVKPGRAYRAYRFPHRKGGRLSRRYASAGTRVGTFAGALTALILGIALFLGGSAAAVVGYFAADLPAAHALRKLGRDDGLAIGQGQLERAPRLQGLRAGRCQFGPGCGLTGAGGRRQCDHDGATGKTATT